MSKTISIMIKPASSLCNLKCKYCFYTDLADRRACPSHGIMTRETMQAMLKTVEDALGDQDQVIFVFQGGEPTLAGLDFYRAFTGIVAGWPEKVRVSYAFQTNGILLDEDWCRFFTENKVLVGVSLDLPKEAHAFARTDPEGKDTWKSVVSVLSLLKASGVNFNILSTLTKNAAKHPQKVWNAIRDLDLPYVQFTPCLDALTPQEENRFALTPQLFADFYSQLFDIWFEEYRKGRYRSIKFFDDLVNRLAFGVCPACGMDGRCSPQLVVESSGETYPCDFYCLDEYCLGNITDTDLETLYERSVSSPQKEAETLPAACGACPYRNFCGGGCKRMRRETCVDEQAGICGMQLFLHHSMEGLQAIARLERSYAGR